MIDTTHDDRATRALLFVHADRALHARIRAEYLEMPGLRLTLAQAARLFNLELTHCSRVLNALVTDGTLWTNGREFLRSNIGRRVVRTPERVIDRG